MLIFGSWQRNQPPPQTDLFASKVHYQSKHVADISELKLGAGEAWHRNFSDTSSRQFQPKNPDRMSSKDIPRLSGLSSAGFDGDHENLNGTHESPSSTISTSQSPRSASSQPAGKGRALLDTVGKIAGAIVFAKRDSNSGGEDFYGTSTSPTSSDGNYLRKKSTGGSIGGALSRISTGGSSQLNGLDSLKSSQSNSLRSKASLRTVLEPTVYKANEFEVEAVAPGFPTFSLRSYGIDWFRDNSQMITNSIRREVMDLYIVLRSMHERSHMLKEGDILSFFVWFETFAEFFLFIMELIETGLIPWAERSRELPEDSYLESEGGRMKVGKDCMKTVGRVVKHRKDFTAMPPQSAYKKLRKVFQKWVPLLLGYIDSLDDSISEIVHEFCEVDECLNFHRWVAQETLLCKRKETNIILLVRFLDQRPKSLVDWRNSNLKPLQRSAHPQQWKIVEKNHFEVVSYFRRCTPSLQKN